MRKVKIVLTLAEIICIAVAPLAIIFFNAATTGEGESSAIEMSASVVLYLILVLWLVYKSVIMRRLGKGNVRLERRLAELEKATDPFEIMALKSAVRSEGTRDVVSAFILPAAVLGALYALGHSIESHLVKKIGVPVFHLSGTIGFISLFVLAGFLFAVINAQIVVKEEEPKEERNEK